ncbi:carboxypeptidase-like regulatory domain-containing protein [Bacteroides sp. 519]|uniref:carboxypeptidase-like regulatory domain-containing protein n=1 Tax=Bacteroides sp. 519 TaxID=2302937 RepID=UPI0013D7C182|nr:carboxypeptidase-like regulatory domain-containing protein [Bacteroides sp. 519]
MNSLQKASALVLFIVLSIASYAQSDWKLGPDETFVFEINNKEALKLLKTNTYKGIVKTMLHSPKGSFTGKSWTNTPEQGHFIYVNIHKNKVDYSYHPIIPFQVFLFKEYGVLTLQVVDNDGNIRRDAKVKLERDRVPYDPASQTYTVNDESDKEKRILTVELNKFQAVFDLQKHFVNPYWNNDDDDEDDRPDFYSYLITDKNKYKPGETIRFKSYALTGRKTPIKKDLEVWMRTSNRSWSYKKVGTVSPHHPGGFAGEIHLHDSLELLLDQHYSFHLKDQKGRFVAQTNFLYEDYELYDNSLNINLSANRHYYPNTNKLEIAATDVNGLFLPDMKASVTILRRNVLTSYTDILMLPDTLYNQDIDLDSSGPTTIDIPASLFKESDCEYLINVLAFTPDNQRMERNTYATFFRSSYDILQTIEGDEICFSFHELGVEKNVEAEISYGDNELYKRVTLPYREKFDQKIDYYSVKVPQYCKSFSTSMIYTGLELNGGIENGKLDLELINPLGLNFTWYLYEGNILIQKGGQKGFDFVPHKAIDENKTYYLEIFYYIGEEERAFRRTFSADPKHLRMDVNLPERIYPGQKVNSTITVKDYNGKPIPNVDITAFAYNSLLRHYVPDLPYYGKTSEGREQRVSYSMSRKSFLYSGDLDYNYWKTRAGLDKLEYYQFLHPTDSMFRYEVASPDYVTQFAPFVIANGEQVEIYVIERNDTPIYFSWTEQPKAYSFPVNSWGRPEKITLRLYDRAIVFDSLYFAHGKKTILSIDFDNLPKEAKSIYLGGFRHHEQTRYEKLIARFPIANTKEATYLRRGVDSTLVYHPIFGHRNQTVLVGPIPEGYSSYNGGVRYRHAGGYSYQFEDNIVYREKENNLFPRSLFKCTYEDFRNLYDFYFSPTVWNNILMANKRSGFIWHPQSIHISQQNMDINLRLPVEADASGVANLLFQQIDTDSIISPDRLEYGTRKFTQIPYDTYHVIVLYNNGKYLRKDSVSLKANTYLQVDMTSAPVHEKDSISEQWLLLNTHSAAIAQRSLINTYQNTETYIRHTFHHPATLNGTGNVSGYVYDSSGEPLIGVSVLISGTSQGTITDIDGYFSINVTSENDVLEFFYIGYKKKTIKADGKSKLSVVLEEDDLALDEVVVVGYGTQRKSMSSAAAEKPAPSDTPAEEFEESDDDVETQVAEKKLYNELLMMNGLRRNFSDVGFWEPKLYTDKLGQAEFTVTFPDNITRWDAVIYAMNRKLQTATFRHSIRSYKPLMGELKTPQFLTVGDSSYFSGTVRNYTGDAQIDGKIVFTHQGDTLINKEIDFKNLHTDKLLVHVPCDTDSITTQYIFTRNDGYTDGEERSIVIVPQGTEVADGTLQFLRNGETHNFRAHDNEEVHLTITGKQLDVYVSAMQYLGGYKYACNEQLASKLIGLLNYKLYAAYAGKKFNYDKDINHIIKRLVGNQNDEKLWSWWGRTSNTSYWMSAHILRALNMAKKAGYTVALNTQTIETNYKDITSYRKINVYRDIETLYALSEIGASEDYLAAVDTLQKELRVEEIRLDSIAKAHKYTPHSLLKEKMMLWDIQQRQGVSVTDSLRQYLKEDILGLVYCEDDKSIRSWYSNKMQSTLIAYNMIKRDSALVHLKEPMQMYILGSREYGWNTYQAATVVSTVLPDLLEGTGTQNQPANIQLKGKYNEEVTTFPFQTTLLPGEELEVKKIDGIPLIYSVHSYKRVTEASDSKAFDVTTTLETETLTAGIPVKMRVDVTVKQEGAEHVMIEIPLPAGCSYASKWSYNYYYYGTETHREYFKEKTSIFCEKLPQGKYHFIIELLPRYTGNYILNPAKVELMYQPVIHANNDMREVRIEERE